VAAFLCGGGAAWLLFLNLFGEGVLGIFGLAAAIAFAVGLVLVWIIVRRWPESELPKTWDTH
jgi:hypothetical protein